MSKFLSGRIKELLLGVVGRTEDKTVLQTTGTVGIGTTNSVDYTLYVNGSTNIDGGLTVGSASTFSDDLNVGTGVTIYGNSGIVSATSFYGDGTNLTNVGVDVADDTTPQLGGDLDLNSNNITGTGNIDITGIITATSFTGNLTGTATTATNVAVTTSISDTNFKVPFLNTSGNTDGNYGLLHDSSSTSFTYNPLENELSVGGLDTFNLYVDDDIQFKTGSTVESRIFYDSTANDLEIELESVATKIAITDNGTYKHIITKDGKVGINTSVTPTVELDVNGDVNVSGVSTFNDDVSLADKIIHTGDTDTAIRFPAADTFTVETSGVERFRITSTGAIGIGTNNPGQKLHIIGDGNPVILLEDGSGTDQTFARYKSSSGNWSAGADHRDDAFIINKSTNLRTGTPELYVHSNIGVGIGTTNPNSEVKSNNNRIFHAGIVTSRFYYGDGSNLTGIDAGQVGALTDIVNDTTPQLGGDLDLNSNNITGTGNIDITGNLNVSGVSTFQSHVHLGDDDELRFGANNDFKIYHDPNDARIENSNGDIKFKNTGSYFFFDEDGGETLASFINDGAANLFYSGSKKFETTASGIDVTGHIETDTLNVSGVSTFQNNIHLLDDDKLLLGGSAGTHDGLEIYHDGNHSYIDDSGTGNLFLRSGTLSVQNLAGSKTSAVFQSGSSQEFYFNNSKKFETTGIGISVSNGAGLTATIAGPSNIIIDPGTVGDNTGTVRIKGDLFVDGTQTQINSTSLEIADFVVGIATTATTDTLSDGAGIKIGPDNTFKYHFNSGTNSSLKSSENLNVASGKGYQVNQVEVLNATTLGSGVINSSLTTVGTLGSLTVSGDVSIADKIIHTGDTDTAIRFPAANTFTVETSGTERLRVTSNGRVSIGTDLTSVQTDAILTTEGSSALTNLDQTLMVMDNNNDNSIGRGGFIGLGGYVNNVPRSLAGIRGLKSSTGSSFNGDLAFYTRQNAVANLDEKLRITHDGNIGIGTEIPTNAVDTNNTAILNVGIVTANFYYGDGSNLTGLTPGLVGALANIVEDTTPQLGGELDVNNNNITGTGNVNLSGIITAIDFNSTSDARLKTNVQVISEPLDKIVRINGVSFNWIENNKPSIGVIADNIQEVLPELVTDTNPKTVNYNGLIGLLIEVVKEQQTQIDSLHERLSRLE